MFQAYKYRLYPDKESSILLNKHFMCAGLPVSYLICKMPKATQYKGVA
jgi:hypothetical protein